MYRITFPPICVAHINGSDRSGSTTLKELWIDGERWLKRIRATLRGKLRAAISCKIYSKRFSNIQLGVCLTVSGGFENNSLVVPEEDSIAEERRQPRHVMCQVEKGDVRGLTQWGWNFKSVWVAKGKLSFMGRKAEICGANLSSSASALIQLEQIFYQLIGRIDGINFRV